MWLPEGTNINETDRMASSQAYLYKEWHRLKE